MARASSDNGGERAGRAEDHGVVEDLYIPSHDGTILILRKIWGGRGRAVLLLPGKGERICDRFYEGLANALRDERTTCYILELRGHGVSEGQWSLRNHRMDVAHVLGMIHKAFSEVYVIAHDWSATVMLEREHTGQAVTGMILLEPRLEPAAEHHARIQTPTFMFSKDTRELLAHVTGPAQVRAGWRKPSTAAEHAAAVRQVQSALAELASHERPIRFATKR